MLLATLELRLGAYQDEPVVYGTQPTHVDRAKELLVVMQGVNWDRMPGSLNASAQARATALLANTN